MTSDTVKNTNEAPVQQEKPAASYSALSGNEAVAQAMRQIEPVVVAAYPITPQTDIVQNFSAFVADGLVRTEFILVESEHSAMSAVVGAAASGVRAMTATASNGLALMYEVLHITSGLRLPVVTSDIAKTHIGRPIPNTPMVAALIKVLDLVSDADLEMLIGDKLRKKFRGNEGLVRGNLEAISRAYREVNAQ